MIIKRIRNTFESVTRLFPILMHIGGGGEEERRDIKDLTPSQTLPIFFWLSLNSLWKKLLLLSLHRATMLFRYFLKISNKRDLRAGYFSFAKHFRRWSLLFIEVRIPLVIQGLDFLLLLKWDFFFKGACLSKRHPMCYKKYHKIDWGLPHPDVNHT